MSTPLATAVVAFVAGHLQGISPANGYYTDAGNRVHTDDVALAELAGPQIVIVATGMPRMTDPPGRYGRTLELRIEFMAPVTQAQSATDEGWKLAADVDAALIKARKALDDPSDLTAPPGLLALDGQSLQLPRRDSGSNIQEGLAVWWAKTDRFFTDATQ